MCFWFPFVFFVSSYPINKAGTKNNTLAWKESLDLFLCGAFSFEVSLHWASGLDELVPPRGDKDEAIDASNCSFFGNLDVRLPVDLLHVGR